MMFSNRHGIKIGSVSYYILGYFLLWCKLKVNIMSLATNYMSFKNEKSVIDKANIRGEFMFCMCATHFTLSNNWLNIIHKTLLERQTYFGCKVKYSSAHYMDSMLIEIERWLDKAVMICEASFKWDFTSAYCF